MSSQRMVSSRILVKWGRAYLGKYGKAQRGSDPPEARKNGGLDGLEDWVMAERIGYYVPIAKDCVDDEGIAYEADRQTEDGGTDFKEHM